MKTPTAGVVVTCVPTCGAKRSSAPTTWRPNAKAIPHRRPPTHLSVFSALLAQKKEKIRHVGFFGSVSARSRWVDIGYNASNSRPWGPILRSFTVRSRRFPCRPFPFREARLISQALGLDASPNVSTLSESISSKCGRRGMDLFLLRRKHRPFFTNEDVTFRSMVSGQRFLCQARS